MAIGGVVVLALIAGVSVFWFFGRSAPDRVDIDTAARGVTTTTTGGGDAAGRTSSTGGIEGTWNVDTTTGEFDFNSATGTFAGYRIREELAGIGKTEAVGRTGEVSGSLTIAGTTAGTTVESAKITVGLTSLTSNESMRDRRVQDALATDEHPDATFELAEPIELGDDAASGATIEITAQGRLTVHGVTHDVSVPLQARLVDQTVVVVGSIDISFADYGVKIPSGMKVLSVEDHGTIEFQLLLTR